MCSSAMAQRRRCQLHIVAVGLHKTKKDSRLQCGPCAVCASTRSPRVCVCVSLCSSCDSPSRCPPPRRHQLRGHTYFRAHTRRSSDTQGAVIYGARSLSVHTGNSNTRWRRRGDYGEGRVRLLSVLRSLSIESHTLYRTDTIALESHACLFPRDTVKTSEIKRGTHFCLCWWWDLV